MKKKILIIGPSMEIGGVERSLIGLLNSINYEEYDVDLFLRSHRGELFSLIDSRVNILSEDKDYSLSMLPLNELMKGHNYKLLILRVVSKLYGSIRSKFLGRDTVSAILFKKYIEKRIKPFEKHYDYALGFFWPHYMLDKKVSADVKIGWVHTDYGNKDEKFDMSFYKSMWKNIDYIACVSEQVKESFDLIYPEFRNKTIVVENTLSTDFVRKQADELIPDEMNFDGMKVLSVGRFSTAKNFDNIPEVCSILAQKGYMFKWYLIGYGPDEKLIKSKIKEYNMEDYVVLLGKKENPYPYMKNCDIYVQPSRYEGKAVTVREAQILNKPVVITRFDTAASQVEEGVDGYICELSVDGIIDGIEYLINNSDVRNRLIENTKKRDYSNSDQFEKLMEFIN